MADTILHKRSLDSGSVPSTSSLQIGELALNAADGKIFLKKTGSAGESITTAITTDTINYGNVIISGSLSLSGSNSEIFSVYSDQIDFDFDELNFSGSSTFTGSFGVLGDTSIEGSLTVSNGITGSLFGTASWAENSITASHALNVVHKTTELEQNLDLGIEYINGNFQEVIVPEFDDIGGFGGLHGFRYVHKYRSLFGSKRTLNNSDYSFFKWENLNDLSSYIFVTASNLPANYQGADQIVYSAYKDKLYAAMMDFNYNAASTRVVISEIDPINLDNDVVLNVDMGASWWGAIGSPVATEDKYLYVSYVDKNILQSRFYKIDLDDFSYSSLTFNNPIGTNSTPHSMVIDSGSLYFTTMWGSPNYIGKINLDSFTLESSASIPGTGSAYTLTVSDDMVNVGNYIYVTTEGYPNNDVIKINKNDLSDQTSLNILKNSGSDNIYCLKLLDNGDLLYGGTNNTIGIYNINTHENTLYNNPFTNPTINELYYDTELIYLAGFDSYPVSGSGFVGKLHKSSLEAKNVKYNYGITGSLFGTASWAENAVTASYVATASYIPTFQQITDAGNTTTNDIEVESIKISGSQPSLFYTNTGSPIATFRQLSGAEGKLRVEAQQQGNGVYSNYIEIAAHNNSRSYINFKGAQYIAQSGFNLTIGAGATGTLGSTLGVKGSGATSSTTAFRVENSNASVSMTVLNNGNVGIGTSTPSKKLHLNVSTNDDGLILTKSGSANNIFRVTMDGANDRGEIFLYNASTPILSIRPSANLSFINTGNNFGIGTSTPSHTLDVSGTGRFTSNLTVTGSALITGSLGITGSVSIESGSLTIYKSGSVVFDIQGSQGQLFSITDQLSGSLFSVNDISGIPILEVFSDDTVKLGTYNSEAIIVSGSTANITGSLYGTASWAENAVSASYVPLTPTFPYTGSAEITGSLVVNSTLYSGFSTSSILSGSTLLYQVNTGSYQAGFFDYYVNSGSNYRAGTLMAVWGNGEVSYTDNSTPDIGNTIDFAFSMSLNNDLAELYSSASSDLWNTKITFRTL